MPRRFRRAAHFNPRSPHGERPSSIAAISASLIFQPTLPARGATNLHSVFQKGTIISTHAPRTGSDLSGRRGARDCPISTHAPRTGSDYMLPMSSQPPPRHFNPRSPHGERLHTLLDNSQFDAFQPTLPARGATAALATAWGVLSKFQPTLPARGATVWERLWIAWVEDFNPRSPHGERRP